jgi:TonB-linked SusC/RagA family outer membrane protein
MKTNLNKNIIMKHVAYWILKFERSFFNKFSSIFKVLIGISLSFCICQSIHAASNLVSKTGALTVRGIENVLKDKDGVVGDTIDENKRMGESSIQDSIENAIIALGIYSDKTSLSYNVQEIDGSTLTKVKQPNFAGSLIGKIAGAQINQSSIGAGGATRIVLRGTKSISAVGNNVLYVIDGIPVQNSNVGDGSIGEDAGVRQTVDYISDLNADDIETISILTGPSACALYGANAANGVIVITTKKGSEKTNLRFNSTTSFGNVTYLPDFQTTYGNTEGEYGSWGEKLSTPSTYDPADYFNTSITYDNSLSFSTGTKNSKSYLSVNHVNSDGVVVNNKYSKLVFTAKHSHVILENKLTFNVGANYFIVSDENRSSQGTDRNPIVEFYTYPRGENPEEFRLFEIYNTESGINERNWTWGSQSLDLQNPYWKQYRMLTENKRKRYMVNASIQWDILKDLNLSVRSQLDKINIDKEEKDYASTYFEVDYDNGRYALREANSRSIYTDAILNYKRSLNTNFNLISNLGVSIKDKQYDNNEQEGYLETANNFSTSNFIDTLQTEQINEYSYQEKSVFASLNLGWKSYAYVTLSGRNDRSESIYNIPSTSFFSHSVGVSVLPSEFIALPSLFDFLKVRAAWSQVGNSINNYINLNTYEDASDSSSYTASMMSFELNPERTTSYEVGLSMGFWDNLINIDVTAYKSNTYDQAFNVDIDDTTGYSNTYVQAGNIENKGIEASLGIDYNITKDFNWKSNIIFSLNKNKIVELCDGCKDSYGNEYDFTSIEVGGYSGLSFNLVEGGSMSDVYIDNKFLRDTEERIVLDEDYNIQVDDQEPYKAGSVAPKYNIGFNNDFTWKQLNFGFLVTARVGGVCFSGTQMELDALGVTQASADARDNGGVKVNSGYIDAETYYSFVNENKIYGDYMYSATNVKFKEVYINYAFNNLLKSDMNLSVGITARDLFMIYCKAPFDPESISVTGTYGQGVDYFMTPSTRNLAVNLTLNF